MVLLTYIQEHNRNTLEHRSMPRVAWSLSSEAWGTSLSMAGTSLGCGNVSDWENQAVLDIGALLFRVLQLERATKLFGSESCVLTQSEIVGTSRREIEGVGHFVDMS